jgi:hypothetical protein
MIRTVHRCTDNISGLQLIEGHWRTNGGAETSFAGSTLLVRAEIEYPEGVYTQVTWSGGAQGSVAASTSVVSDMAAVSIPLGAYFAVQRYITCTAGLCFTQANTRYDIGGFGQDVYNHAASGVTNVVGTNTRATQGGGSAFNMSWPLGIIGYTTRPTIGTIGDSRARGAVTTLTSTVHNAVGESGEIARGLGPTYAVINGGVYGANASTFISAAPLQKAVLERASIICIERGINDIRGGQTAAQLTTTENTLMGMFPGKRFLFSTMPPTDSADSNVSPGPTNAVRNTANANRLARAASGHIVADVASAVETGVGTGLWTATYSTDWTHETEAGYAAIQASSLWDTVRASIGP